MRRKICVFDMRIASTMVSLRGCCFYVDRAIIRCPINAICLYTHDRDNFLYKIEASFACLSLRTQTVWLVYLSHYEIKTRVCRCTFMVL